MTNDFALGLIFGIVLCVVICLAYKEGTEKNK